MGWKQYVRAVEAQQRRAERAQERHRRAVERYQKQAAKVALLEEAQRQAAEYENYVEQLVRVHVECGPHWDWQTLRDASPPVAPPRLATHENTARAVCDAYQPGFFGKLFGGKARKQELETAVSVAKTKDDIFHRSELQVHAQWHAAWEERRRLAPGVLQGDITASRQALVHAGAFDDVECFQSSVALTSLHQGVATLDCVMNDPDLVPREEVKLTASGKLSSKDMAQGKYWLLLQDHVCSCAISVARETFAVLPVSRVIVNMMLRQLNKSTGHIEPCCVLAVHFIPETLSKLRFSALDPSDAMKNFNHRMKFKKSAGFETIERSDQDENWVTT